MQIALTQGFVTEIDEQDYPLISAHKWCAHRCGTKVYAGTNIGGKSVRLHTMLTGYPLTDHIDGDSLNNKRANLRPCTRVQNMQNSPKGRKRRRSSLLKGVRWHKHARRWEARIRVNGKNLNLGLFQAEEDAGRAYREAALIHFGEFAPPEVRNQLVR